MTDFHYASRLAAAEATAACVCDLFPGAQLAGSHITSVDFSCDFLLTQPVDDQAIPLLEENIRAFLKAGIPIHRIEMMRENAAAYLEHLGQPYVAQLIRASPQNIVSLMEIGSFRTFSSQEESVTWPENTREIGAIKILEISREITYFPEEGEIPITRIRGCSFPDLQQIKKFYKRWDKAKAIDHRLLGQEMGLFCPAEGMFPRSYCWLPRGGALRDHLMSWWKAALSRHGFSLVSTPGLIASSEGILCSIEGETYAALPDRVRAHARVYLMEEQLRREPVVRYAECAEQWREVSRAEQRGLFNAPLQTVDQLSFFCASGAVSQELISSLQFFHETINMFGFEHQWYLIARRGHRAVGTLRQWDQGAEWLAGALEACDFEYAKDELDSAVLGPRVEMRLSDALGRQWAGPSLGLVTHLPELGEKSLMLTGSLMGSVERFAALLLERYSGQLPLWLAPEQVRILPLGDRQTETAESVRRRLTEAGFRVGIDVREDKLGSKVHAAERERVPYLAIVGEKEERDGLITVRSCYRDEMNHRMDLEHFIKQLRTEH